MTEVSKYTLANICEIAVKNHVIYYVKTRSYCKPKAATYERHCLGSAEDGG